jgi:hypothetical protein
LKSAAWGQGNFEFQIELLSSFSALRTADFAWHSAERESEQGR